MKYGDHIPFLQRELESLGRKPLSLSFQAFRQAMEGEDSDEADAACRSFVATLQWPPLSDAARFEVCLRLSCAQWWCKECEDEDPGDEHGREFLTGLLILIAALNARIFI